ncbi:MAG TPA: hypothetical protein VGM87_01185 [Roseomonas sp.]
MNILIETRPDADLHPHLLTTLIAPLPADKGPEPCGLTPDEIRQIILDLLG